MRAFKIGLAVALVSGAAMAATVNYNLASPQKDQTFPQGTDVTWTVALKASADTAGVATFVADIEVRNKATNALVGNTLSQADYLWSFDVLGKSGGSGAPVNESGKLGGLGMAGVLSTGNNAAAGRLQGFGAGFATPWDALQTETIGGKKVLTGSMVWGLGLDSRKANLLLDPAGNYDVAGGTIPTTGLPNGTYVVTIIPGNTNVLKSDVDLNRDVDTSFVAPAERIGSSFEFTVPEPATLLLLAGAGLLIRRRTA